MSGHNMDGLINTHVVGDKHIQLWRERKPLFNATTTSQESYRSYGNELDRAIPYQERKKSLEGVLSFEDNKFYAGTTSRSTYKAYEIERKPEQAQQQYEKSNAKFYGTTTARDSYVAHKAAPPPAPSASASLQSFRIPQNDQFYGETTSRSTFKPYEKGDRADVAPRNDKSLDGVLRSVDGKAYFDGSTTNKEMFKAWQVEKTKAAGNVFESHADDYFDRSTSGLYQSTYGSTFAGWQLPKNRASLSLDTINESFVMIPRNESLPAKHTQIFTTVTDNQNTVDIVIRQGESRRPNENEILGSFELVDIPNAPCGDPQIQVTFHINEHNILHVDAVDRLTGKAQRIAIDKSLNPKAFSS